MGKLSVIFGKLLKERSASLDALESKTSRRRWDCEKKEEYVVSVFFMSKVACFQEGYVLKQQILDQLIPFYDSLKGNSSQVFLLLTKMLG